MRNNYDYDDYDDYDSYDCYEDGKECDICSTNMVSQDDSFDHEFGTQKDYSWHCEFCESNEDHEEAVQEHMYNTADKEMLKHWLVLQNEYRLMKAELLKKRKTF